MTIGLPALVGLIVLAILAIVQPLICLLLLRDRDRQIRRMREDHGMERERWRSRIRELATEVTMLTREFAEWRGMWNLRRAKRDQG